MSWWASRTGWACCIWVRPGITVSPACSAWPISAWTTSMICPAMKRAWRRSHMRISAAIWSLRDRPARSLPPSSSPAMSSRPRSSAVASSSSSSMGVNDPSSTERCSWSSAASIRLSSSLVSSPARPRARAWAREPAMSSSASRQSNWVDLLSRASSGEGPDENRPPHSAIECSGAFECSCSLFCSMDVGVFLCCLGCRIRRCRMQCCRTRYSAGSLCLTLHR